MQILLKPYCAGYFFIQTVIVLFLFSKIYLHILLVALIRFERKNKPSGFKNIKIYIVDKEASVFSRFIGSGHFLFSSCCFLFSRKSMLQKLTSIILISGILMLNELLFSTQYNFYTFFYLLYNTGFFSEK